jgi:hypothetical protein
MSGRVATSQATNAYGQIGVKCLTPEVNTLGFELIAVKKQSVALRRNHNGARDADKPVATETGSTKDSRFMGASAFRRTP